MHLHLPLILSALVATVHCAARTSPPAGAIIVAKSGGQFSSIQSAIDSIKSATGSKIIFIQSGTYTEQVYIPKTMKATLTIYGATPNDQDYSKNTVTLQHNLGADKAGSNDASATLRAWADNLQVYNVNIANTRGKGIQAIALSAQGTRQAYYGVQLKGYQDTLLANVGTQVYVRSYIEGATDFIFGQKAVAWLEKCTIGVSGGGFITASGRDGDANPSWYVLNAVTVKGLAGVANGATYLGRPWRNYARVVVQNSSLGAVVNGAGWRYWNADDKRVDKVSWGEFGNTGAGASGTRAYGKKLAAAVTLEAVVGSTSFIDMSYWNGKAAAKRSVSRIMRCRL